MVPAKARACPECGSDDSTGWSDDAQCDRLGVPGESFDYDRYVEEEFSEKTRRTGPHWIWMLVGIALAVWLLVSWFRR